MEGCWSRRGCDDEMQGRCPHNVPGEPCPADCHYAACHRPTHVVCEDFGVLLNPNRDYDAAVKQVCHFCERAGYRSGDPHARQVQRPQPLPSLGFDIGFEKNGHKIDFWVLNGNLEEEKLMY